MGTPRDSIIIMSVDRMPPQITFHFHQMPPFPLLLALTATLFTAVRSQNAAATFPDCNRTFSCGTITNITYPFTGGDRPSYCGLPAFSLTCRDDAITEMTQDSLIYRVLQLDQTQKTLVLSRSDLYATTCPSEFRNTTLNSSLFSYDGIQNEDLSLFYGCNTSLFTMTPTNLFHCNSSGFSFTSACYIIGPVPSDPNLRILTCSVSIKVPVLRDVSKLLLNSTLTLGKALTEGFGVNYVDPYEKLCSGCGRLGGRCGFDSGLGKPVCICEDRPCPFAVTLTPEASSNTSEETAADSNGKNKEITLALSLTSGMVIILIGISLFLYCRKQSKDTRIRTKGKHFGSNEKDPELPLFDLSIILKATNHFSIDNKLGEGGFGPVYKGVLEGGQEIAVKRLSKDSKQGLDEFKNEINFIVKLQHINLVRLLGGCVQGEEHMLIYEYMPNKSLDIILFDQTKSMSLDWKKRFNIINGISRGLMYLHQDSRLRIIHRDLKASNVLLDSEMNPKISDFGLARSFGRNETEAITRRVVGTYGYMSPEYAIDGLFSLKSDVFSLGVLLLEIVSGMRNRMFSHPDHNLNLLGHAWKLYKEGKSLEIVDPCLTESLYISEMVRTIHVGLLCVQQNPEDRPSMSTVVFMLSNEGVFPQANHPGFFTEREVIDAQASTDMNAANSTNQVAITTLEAR